MLTRTPDRSETRRGAIRATISSIEFVNSCRWLEKNSSKALRKERRLGTAERQNALDGGAPRKLAGYRKSCEAFGQCVAAVFVIAPVRSEG